MDFGISDAFQIIGSLCFFVYGMKMMSDGIQRAAGSQLRNILRTMTKNRFLGVFTGILITALVQSSSATTVMVVSFVNAGLLTLLESAGVMLGANIGTTITGWIVSILGFKIKLSAYSIPLFALGVPMMFTDRGKLKYWGEFITGFAILFMGLSFLKDSVPDLKGTPEIFENLKAFTSWGILSRIFFVIVGTIVTVVVQSSSAAMAITLTMCANGWLPFDVAAAMILGENIGTTITAQVAALVGNTNAKRAANIHTLFNVFGVIWMVVVLPWFLVALSNFLQYLGQGDPFASAEAMPIGLSAFHTAFNIINVVVLVGFIPFLVKISTKFSRGGKEEDEEPSLKFISSNTVTPELATMQLQKEAAHFGDIVSRMSGFTYDLLNSTEEKNQRKLLKKMKKYEKITDKMEIEITEYITKLADKEITPKTSMQLRGILNICNDLERIGDIYYQVSKTLERKIDEKMYFVQEQREGINEMISLIDEAFVEMVNNLSTANYDDVTKDKAVSLEKKINTHRDKLRSGNLARLGESDYNVESAMIFNNIFSSLERIGDHIINVTESVVGEI